MVLCSAMAFFYQYPMNLREQIIQWLDDGYYLQGVALYRQVGGIYPISTFEGYEEANYVPEAVEQKLRYALENYLTDNPVFEQEVVYHPPKKKTIHFQEVESILFLFLLLWHIQKERPCQLCNNKHSKPVFFAITYVRSFST